MAHYKGAASEGGRAQILIKKRQKEQEEMEMKRKKIEEDLSVGSIQNKFASHYDAVEQQLKSNTIGLVTLDEMKAKQETLIKQREKQLAKKNAEARLIEKEKEDKKRKEKMKIAALSFDPDEDEEEDEEEEEGEEEEEKEPVDILNKKKRLGMNPDVDTSFLPDRDREEAENKLREQIAQEWMQKQEHVKNEEIDITYSYWDGSGHRRQVRMKKGNSIQQFLQKCLETLRREFNDLKAVTVDQLMYVKEDLIIPHHYTFYDFIVTKARGKSGPLFNFNVKDDIRIINDASVEKEESHAGKVCIRSWYERSKHIFPASRWEPYDPEKKWDSYSVSDKNAAKITVK
ncbi:protein FAM50A-like [Ruditapes philippinarum]|uniref:protein FAM50A-like n=1 Tax=Ruditapes philippinarum TaxID=129788 RepID=UPI00295B71AD|nr:protein FAM50A-like [Ruditapes philippinarum]XP_060560045.1 protein FAM50A-like [Ruditapes philippinarum]XP_060560047.1 protein FAM50A-like [Ruditapes philippinarum]